MLCGTNLRLNDLDRQILLLSANPATRYQQPVARSCGSITATTVRAGTTSMPTESDTHRGQIGVQPLKIALLIGTTPPRGSMGRVMTEALVPTPKRPRVPHDRDGRGRPLALQGVAGRVAPDQGTGGAEAGNACAAPVTLRNMSPTPALTREGLRTGLTTMRPSLLEARHESAPCGHIVARSLRGPRARARSLARNPQPAA